MRRANVVVAVTSLGLTAVTAALVPATATVHHRGPAIRFGVPRIVDPIHTYGEPDIKVAPNGTTYVSGPQGTGVQRSIWNVSYDGGDSYRLVQDNKLGSPPSAAAPTKSTVGPGGGDTEIAVDRHSNVYYSDLAALACFTTAYSHDNGRTISSTPLGCSTPGADRQWMGVFDPAPADHTISPYKGPRPLVYLKYTAEGLGGGTRVDWAAGKDPSDWHQGDPAATYGDGGGHGTTDAPIVIDQHTGDLLSLADSGSHTLSLAVGVPAKDGSAHLNFHYDPVVSKLKGDPNTLFPGFAEDRARNLYAVWVQDNDYQVYYSWAAPKGNDWGRWHTPVRINRPPSATNLMPWVAAGGDGVIDVAWYGTDKTLKELGPQGPSAQKNQAWWTWFAQIDHAASDKPHIVQAPASQHPMHYNDICMLGTGCIAAQGNRNLADFFEVTIDNEGRAVIVYDDTSNRLVSAAGAIEAADHSGAALVTTVTQQTGLNAWTGRPLRAKESTAPRSTILDPPGDARYPVLGGARLTGADIERVALSQHKHALRIAITLRHGTLGEAAQSAAAPYGRLIVRWQMGNVLYHAGVDEDVAGNDSFYGGLTTTTDSCSVSACDPHTLDYGAPPLPGTATAAGRRQVGQNTVYTIDVPLSAIGSPRSGRLLESVAAYVFGAAAPGNWPDQKTQSDADEVPLELEGTRTFNFRF